MERIEERIKRLANNLFDIEVVGKILDLMDKYYEENSRNEFYAFLDGIETILEKLKEIQE